MREDACLGPGLAGSDSRSDHITDSKNRTAAEIKHLLSLYGVALASPGSASWAFEKTSEGFAPTMTTSISQEDGEALLALVDALEEHDDVQTVYTNAE